MKILILTSKDHIYANYLLRMLFERGVVSRHAVMIWEQDAVVPGRSKWQGLMKYFRRAGFRYVSAQILKQQLFLVFRITAMLSRDVQSLFYPYWRISGYTASREAFSGIKSEEAFRQVKQYKPDVILSLFSKEIIPDRILRIPKRGSYNLHPAPLPSYRGVSPIFWAMSENRRTAGITLHELDVGIDTGRIISQKKIAMHPGDTEHGVYLRLVRFGAELLAVFCAQLTSGQQIRDKAAQQKKTGYYSLPTREAVRTLLDNGYSFFRIQEMMTARS